MARHFSPPPDPFALLVSDAIRRELGAQRWSGREFARRLGRSEGYVRERLKDQYEWSLNDIDMLCREIGVLPEDFIARVEGDELYYRAYGPKASNVSASDQSEGESTNPDADDYALAASDRLTYETEQEREQEQP